MQVGGQVTPTRWAHHVIAASLSVLQRAAYQHYFDMHLADDSLPTLHERCKIQKFTHVRKYTIAATYLTQIFPLGGSTLVAPRHLRWRRLKELG